MNELIHSLQESMDRLEQGKLGLEALDECVVQARAVYERFVVLRHKAREAAVEAGRTAHATPPKEVPKPSAVAEPVPSIRLDTRPPEVHPQQTSLIDAIAETEAVEPAAAKAAPPPRREPVKPASMAAERPVTVADKLEQAPVADLRKAIALSQKFWFVAELFNGDRKLYEDTIDALNGMDGFPAAEAFLREQVTAKLPKPPGEEVATAFKDLLQRRFH